MRSINRRIRIAAFVLLSLVATSVLADVEIPSGGSFNLNGGTVTRRQPRSSHPSLTPSQLYRTKDGWIFIMCQKEKFWRLLCEALGRPEWIEDPAYSTFAARLANRPQINAALDDAKVDTINALAGRSRRRQS